MSTDFLPGVAGYLHALVPCHEPASEQYLSQ